MFTVAPLREPFVIHAPPVADQFAFVALAGTLATATVAVPDEPELTQIVEGVTDKEGVV